MTTYTRLTVIGPDRRAELVVPDGEPVAAMLPDILTLLEHDQGPVVLVTRTGDQLDAALSLADQDVADGTPLWVTPLDQAPPPVQVADITDLTADQHDTRADAWSRIWALVAAVPVMAVLAWLASRELGQVAAVVVLAALVVAACTLARLRRTPTAVLATAAGTGTAVQVAVTLPDARPGWLVALACFALVSAVCALVGVTGFGDRALGIGGATGALLVLAVFGIIEVAASLANAAATVAVLGVLVLGVAPGIAMTASGLSGLDDRLVTGHDTPRAQARATVAAAYRSLTWLVTACVVVVATCSAVAAGAGQWGRWLAIGSVIVLVLRMRVFPLVPQRITLALGGLAVTVGLLRGLASGPATTGALCVIAVVVATVVARPSPIVVARLNRLGDYLETLAVVALVPLLLALWGVFGDLAGAF